MEEHRDTEGRWFEPSHVSKATVGGWTAGDRYNRFIWVGVSYQPSDNVNITVALIFPKNNSCNVPSAKRFNGLSAKYPHYSWSSEGLKTIAMKKQKIVNLWSKKTTISEGVVTDKRIYKRVTKQTDGYDVKVYWFAVNGGKKKPVPYDEQQHLEELYQAKIKQQ